MQFGAIQGPYTENLITNCHFSPFLTREKSNASHRRVIIDLSWPKDASVNLGVDKNSYLASDFQLTFPTVDDIIDAINDVGRGDCLYKVDISRAFRHVKIDPFDYDLLGLKWRDVAFFDTCLPFGSRHGTQIFQRISDKMRRIENMLHDWQLKTFASRQQLQSLLGNLLYIHKCVKPARIFLNHMLQLLRDNYDKNSITLTHDFRRDRRWFVKFVRSYNITSFFYHKPIEATIELDACLTGFGGRWGSLSCTNRKGVQKPGHNSA